MNLLKKLFGSASPEPPEPPAAEPPGGFGPWRARPMFISSTFRDMHAERDWMRDRVFPELEERLRAHRHHLEIIDLRQGVETASLGEQESRELKVLEVCLAEIERSRPFLIVLLGDRYGWTPPPERLEAAAREAGFAAGGTGRSVTALEIEFGILRKHPEQRRRCFFYFRDPLPYGQMPPGKAAEYSDEHATDAEAPGRRAALDALKLRIETDPELGPRVRHYQGGWDPQASRVTGLETWGRQVLADLWGELEAETRAFALAAPPTWQAQERAAIEEFVEHRLRGFTGRGPVVRQLLEIALGQADRAVGACVTGGPGAGKSALFAQVYRRLKDERDTLVLAHAAGSGSRSASVDDMLRCWIEELAGFLHARPDLPENAPPDDVEKTFTSLLHRAAAQCRVVALVDTLNQFERTAQGQYVTWFDARRWPANARILATAIAGTESAALCRQAGVRELNVPELTQDEARDIGNAVWSRYHRECNPQVLDAVLGAPACSNPLWLTLAMEQLNLLGADDYTRAGENLLDLLLEEARRLPGEIEGLYAAILARAEKVYGAHWARPFACLLALSRQGWRESDLEGMLPAAARILFPEGGDAAFRWDPLQFATLRRGFRAHIVQRGTLGQWDFFHAQVRRAVLRQYLGDAETVRRLHSATVDHLLRLPEPDQLRLRETMFHLMGAEDGARAARFYAHVEPAGEATRTLAETLIDTDEGRTALGLSWVASLSAESGLDPETAWLLCNRFQFHLNDAIQNRARLAVRLRLLEAVHGSLGKLAAAEPSDTQWQHDLSISHNHLGDVLKAQGEMGGALAAYRDALAISQRLAAVEPAKAQWQDDLSTSHNNLGELLIAQGDVGGALAAYMDAHAIAQRLAVTDPSNIVWQQRLAVSHSRLGDVLSAHGDIRRALAAYQCALAIEQTLAAAEPSNPQRQRDLTISHLKLGDGQSAHGDIGGALAAYRCALAIAQRLAAVDPSNAQWQRGLSICHLKLGYVLSVQGDAAGMLASYRDSHAIAQGLAAADPSNAEWQRDLGISHEKMGDVLSAQGDVGGALAAYREAHAIAQRQAAAEPSNTQWQRDLSICQNKLGDVLRARGDRGGALAAYRDALAIRQRLAADDPPNAQWQRDLIVSYARMAETTEQSGAGGAQQWWGKAHETLAGMKRRGLYLSPQDERNLALLKAKSGGL
jgi:tetratricopeptide (TPR) repeat protein